MEYEECIICGALMYHNGNCPRCTLRNFLQKLDNDYEFIEENDYGKNEETFDDSQFYFNISQNIKMCNDCEEFYSVYEEHTCPNKNRTCLHCENLLTDDQLVLCSYCLWKNSEPDPEPVYTLGSYTTLHFKIKKIDSKKIC